MIDTLTYHGRPACRIRCANPSLRMLDITSLRGGTLRVVGATLTPPDTAIVLAQTKSFDADAAAAAAAARLNRAVGCSSKLKTIRMADAVPLVFPFTTKLEQAIFVAALKVRQDLKEKRVPGYFYPTLAQVSQKMGLPVTSLVKELREVDSGDQLLREKRPMGLGPYVPRLHNPPSKRRILLEPQFVRRSEFEKHYPNILPPKT